MKKALFKLFILSTIFCFLNFWASADLCTTCYHEQTHYAPEGWGYWIEVSTWCSPAGLSAPCGRNNYCHCFEGGWYDECNAKFCQPLPECQSDPNPA